MLRLHKRLLLVIFGLLLVVVPAFAQDANAPGMLRFVHVIPGAAAIDIYTDGELTITNLDYGQASLYVQVEPGAHTLTVTQHGDSGSVWEQEVNTTAGAALTLVASSTDPLAFQVYQDDLSPLTLGSARLTAIHAIPGAAGLDVLLTDGRAVMPGLQYDVPYGTLDVPAAFYDVAVVSEGDSIEDAILPATTLELSSGVSYMAVIFGTEEAPSWLLLSASTQGEGQVGYVRFKNATYDLDLDITLNDVLVSPSLSLSDPVTQYIALPAGSYNVVIQGNVPGVNAITDTLEVTAGEYWTMIFPPSTVDAGIQWIEDSVSTVNADESVVSVISLLADGTVSISLGNAEILGDVAAGENDSAILEPGETPLTASVTVDGDAQSFDLAEVVYGGVYYSVLALNDVDGPRALLLGPVSLAQGPASAPGDSTLEVAAPDETEATSAPEAVVTVTAEPTAEIPPEVTAETPEAAATEAIEAQPTAAPAATGPSARVLLNEGANLHIRQFPSSDALSLGLAPAGAVLSVTGRQGAPELAPEETPEPEATEFVDPATLLTGEGADLNPADTWLFVTFRPASGGEITGWANALFLTVSDSAGRSQRLADLPTVPANRAGETRETSSAPQATSTPIAADSVIATVLLNPGANLHLRRNPSASAESLALIPNAAQLIVTGRLDTGEWLQVTYEGQQGWVASEFVTLSLNGLPYPSARVPVLATPTPTPTAEATPAV